MLKFIPTILGSLFLLLSFTSFFLSLWIFIPAPTVALMTLSVGMPEISPWLLLVNLGLAIALLLFAILFGFRWTIWLSLLLITAAFVMAMTPLMQFQRVQNNADRAMHAVVENHQVPEIVQAQWRSSPFVLSDAFGGIAKRAIRTRSGITFGTPDGVDLKLNVYQPEKVGNYPAIVVIHGGAWQRGNANQDAAFNQYMAAQGYVVWAITYRHAPKYHFPAQIDDVRSALAFIRQHAVEYETDLTRMAIMGRSAGSQLAMLAAYQASPIQFRAVVGYYGPVNLTAGYYEVPTPDPIESRSTLKAFLGGTPEEFPALYEQASPLLLAKPQLPPSLLIYGGRDHVVQSQYGRALGTALREQGNQAVFIEIPWADHVFDAVFSGVSNQLALYYTERFLGWALRSPG
ncbi:MAG: alpha/beta hydrolase [Alkalinema sp. RU_4_3]|nr:alpha/beta hydrolase [Alkalinema sp. RU_4_3]